MRRTSLLTQVLVANGALVGLTGLIAAIVAVDRLREAVTSQGVLVLALTITCAFLLNALLLRARLEPIDRLVAAMARVDLSRPGMRVHTPITAASELQQLTTHFNRMLARLEEERREAGRAVVRAQELERGRIAQDLHDEVNQALTAILLRLSATIGDAPRGLQTELRDTQALVGQAMEELLSLARQLRPTALDDHGLIVALSSQVAAFGERTGIASRFLQHGAIGELSEEEQLVIYRVTQEGLSNIAQHARASSVDVELSFVGRPVLRIRDDGVGFDAGPARRGARGRGRPGGLGLSGMRERALLVGAGFAVFSEPRAGTGTTIELTLGGP